MRGIRLRRLSSRGSHCDALVTYAGSSERATRRAPSNGYVSVGMRAPEPAMDREIAFEWDVLRLALHVSDRPIGELDF
jgi:hypothetical protein